jgi:7-keto-8-aminopelargonate synthetase-like enzyme
VRVKSAWEKDPSFSPGPMFALNPKRSRDVERIRARLLASGIFPSLIRYPQGPAPEFFRFAISSEHTGEQLDKLREIAADYL